MTAILLELYDRYHHTNLVTTEEWRKTKYLNSTEEGYLSQDNFPNKSSKIIFEQSIVDSDMYVCVKVGDKMRDDIKNEVLPNDH